jgi:protein O-GlcNAc transferase
LPPQKTTYGHLECYNQIDIGLDTFPYNGATTTLEALWMGVPVITLTGDRVASRYGYSFLSQVGLDELASFNKDEFIKIAVNLSSDIGKLSLLKKKLRNKLKESVLLDGENFAFEMENAYRKMWEIWCSKG